MNKICLVALVVAVLCVFDGEGTSVSEFFNNLPQDISSAFTNTWHNIKKAIKRPVRIRRLGRGGKRKKTTAATSTTLSTTVKQVAKANISTTFGPLFSPLPYAEFRKLEIPVLPTPLWRSLYEWRNLQKPRFAFKSDTSRSHSPGISMLKGLFNINHDTRNTEP